jgi:hypothetical protein
VTDLSAARPNGPRGWIDLGGSYVAAISNVTDTAMALNTRQDFIEIIGKGDYQVSKLIWQRQYHNNRGAEGLVHVINDSRGWFCRHGWATSVSDHLCFKVQQCELQLPENPPDRNRINCGRGAKFDSLRCKNPAAWFAVSNGMYCAFFFNEQSAPGNKLLSLVGEGMRAIQDSHRCAAVSVQVERASKVITARLVSDLPQANSCRAAYGYNRSDSLHPGSPLGRRRLWAWHDLECEPRHQAGQGDSRQFSDETLCHQNSTLAPTGAQLQAEQQLLLKLASDDHAQSICNLGANRLHDFKIISWQVNILQCRRSCAQVLSHEAKDADRPHRSEVLGEQPTGVIGFPPEGLSPGKNIGTGKWPRAGRLHKSLHRRDSGVAGAYSCLQELAALTSHLMPISCYLTLQEPRRANYGRNASNSLRPGRLAFVRIHRAEQVPQPIHGGHAATIPARVA